jgi:YD repeat-containing protein
VLTLYRKLGGGNFNTLNEYPTVNSVAPSYDTNGNLTSQNGSSYTYDAQNRLTSASSVTGSVASSYDPLNRCVVRTINRTTTFYVYDGWNLIEEVGASGVETARYVQGAKIDEMLERVIGSIRAYYHQDALGSDRTHLFEPLRELV